MQVVDYFKGEANSADMIASGGNDYNMEESLQMVSFLWDQVRIFLDR